MGETNTDTDTDETFMRRALDLAIRGVGRVSPNPLVGAVIVRDGCIIGEGWHTAFGMPHAEREALADCMCHGKTARGATMYVTLEPCCHTGKTPPCTDALIEMGIIRVVIGTLDPNPLVAGKGVEVLREAGIEVCVGVLEDACAHVNEAFFHFIRTGRPLVVAKYAMTLDGKVATWKHKSRWITGTQARRRVHEDRARFAAIMVGAGTVMADDPLLTCRLEDFDAVNADSADNGASANNNDAGDSEGTGAQVVSRKKPMRGPVRIIHDPHLHIPLNSQVVITARQVPTIIVTYEYDETAFEPYRAHGCECIMLPEKGTDTEKLVMLMDELAKRGIDGVMIEGGPTLLGLAFDAGIVDKVQAYVAPKIFGGASAPSAVLGAGVDTPDDAIMLSSPKVTRLGDDLLIECEVI